MSTKEDGIETFDILARWDNMHRLVSDTPIIMNNENHITRFILKQQHVWPLIKILLRASLNPGENFKIKMGKKTLWCKVRKTKTRPHS